MENPPLSPFSQKTKDTWFFLALAASVVGLIRVFAPYAYVLLFATVVVVVSWPLFQWLVGVCRGRRALAAGLSVLILVLAVFGPFGFLVYLFINEAIEVIGRAAGYVQSGELNLWVERTTSTLDWVPSWVVVWLPDDFDLRSTIAGPAQRGVLSLLGTAGNALPALLGTTMNFGLDGILFALCVLALYLEGPAVLQTIKHLSPVDDAYEDRLFGVFGEFAHNLVLGTLVTASLQGLLAGVGYAIVGVDQVVFFAMLTGFFGLVPIVGTTVVVAPLVISVWVNQGAGTALFLLVWGLVVGQLDNVLRPLLMRGSTHIHPVLILLAVFGGISWLGVPGVLIGPVIVAFFLALYRIYAVDFLGLPVPSRPEGKGRLAAWLVRLTRRKPSPGR